ncbi:hypothetical protein EXIGLDRAFT_777254 [Exidia glandulosa HHB12029]|uniref:Uncharacterized protein n=1 Tax=Exidia glandulosa HHB12029 TaxID=1314781 RepID=A0A165D4E3_EXIGL|nr:hypothetical protein EXIGLDRAFT_777254 [Exidia glandulosa HHB12029]
MEPPEAASTTSASLAIPSGTDEPRKIASVKRMSALLRSSSSSAETGEEISSTSAPLSRDAVRAESKVACTDNGKPTTRFALPSSTVTASRVTLSSTRPTIYAVKKAVVENSDVKYAKAVLDATNEKIRADKLESQVTELLKRARTTDSDTIKLISEHETVIFGLHTELEAKAKQVLKLQDQLAVANMALQVAASAAQEQTDLARQERDSLERRADSSKNALDEALLGNAELESLCRRHDQVQQWMMVLIVVLMYIGIMLGVLCFCLMSRFVF